MKNPVRFFKIKITTEKSHCDVINNNEFIHVTHSIRNANTSINNNKTLHHLLSSRSHHYATF